MSKYCIEGGKRLCGQVKIQGSKNAVLPMMAASLLHEGITILHNCPHISDVYMMEKILKKMGVETFWKGHSLKIDCSRLENNRISGEDAVSMRSSVLLMGGLLTRSGNVVMGFPGGCTIGKRPVDLHLMVLEKMGAVIETDEAVIRGRCSERMHGADILFPKSSVGATEQGIIAGVLARGCVKLYNCALEPEITHLCHFLQAMGAEIGGIGSSSIWIRGVGALRDAEYIVPSDRIVAGTYLFAAAATRGNISIICPPVAELGAVLKVYEKMGGQWVYKNGKLLADASRIGNPVWEKTGRYPEFPTDLQSALVAVLITIAGKSSVQETIFENRFQIIPELKKMGASIEIEEDKAVIYGGSRLFAADVCATELRGGAALIIAGLMAEGTTILENIHFVERGYENIGKDIAGLGGHIWIRE